MRSSTCPSRCPRPSPASRSPRYSRRTAGWAIPGAGRHQGGLHLDRRHHRTDADRHAISGAHGAAGARRGARRSRGGGRNSRRRPILCVPAHHPARVCPALLTGFALAFARGGRRIRLGDLHRRQSALQDRDHPVPHRHPTRGVRLPRRRRPGLRDAEHLVPRAVGDQLSAALGPPPLHGRRGARWQADPHRPCWRNCVAARSRLAAQQPHALGADQHLAAVPRRAAVRPADHRVRHRIVQGRTAPIWLRSEIRIRCRPSN